MPAYKPIPVWEVRSLAADYTKDIVVIVAMDRENAKLHTTTFGREPADKDIAAKWGELFAQAAGSDTTQATWYEDFRATKEAEYKAKVDALEKRLEAVQDALAPLARPNESEAAVAQRVAAACDKFSTLRPAAEWHEDFGPVLWWHLPIEEPPYVGSGPGAGERNADGTPTTCARLLEEGFLTHWSPLPDCKYLKTSDGTEVTAR